MTKRQRTLIMTKAIRNDEDDYGDYDEEQEAELDRWLADWMMARTRTGDWVIMNRF